MSEPKKGLVSLGLDNAIRLRWALRDIKGKRLKFSPECAKAGDSSAAVFSPDPVSFWRRWKAGQCSDVEISARDRADGTSDHTNHLGRIDDALGDQVDVFAGLRVEAVGILIRFEDLADDHRAVLARVDRDLAGRI